jgi:penicillin-insensitive murein DD-endopeptidase
MRLLSRLLNAAFALCLILLAWAVFGWGGGFVPRLASSARNLAAAPPQPAVAAAPGLAPAATPDPAPAAALEPAPAPAAADAGQELPAERQSRPALSAQEPVSPQPSWSAQVNEKIPAPAPSAPDTAIQVAAAPAPAASPAPTPALPAVPAVITKTTAAKDVFGAVKAPANLATKSIGFYAKGCLAGGQPLPLSGLAWQAMRVSRNRNWGHPSLVKFVERFAEDVKTKDGWPGVLVGDMSMPRGGPMPFGHASHQVGLDVDIWYKPMPDHVLSEKERDEIPMESFLSDPAHVNPQMWTPEHEKLLRRAASYPEVARIFVNPAIKKWLCDNVKGDRNFLKKITPIGGHDDHFHVRLVCPADNPGCVNQHVLASDEGCGKGLDHWIQILARPVPPPAPPKPGAVPVKPKVKPPITMAQLPPECKTVLEAAPVTAAQ